MARASKEIGAGKDGEKRDKKSGIQMNGGEACDWGHGSIEDGE